MNENARNVSFSSENEQWETPEEIFVAIEKFLKIKFTLDPCAEDKTAKCEKYYTIDDDGLSKGWGGEIVFVNPPYSIKKTPIWMNKSMLEGLKENTTVVCLIPARTHTRWWHNYTMRAKEVILIKGRIHFLKEGEHMAAAPFPSAVLVFENHRKSHPTFSAMDRQGNEL